MVHAHRGGLAWFKGHDHFIAVKRFSGTASLTLDVLNPASLSMTIQSDSLEETGADFTPPQKAVIKKELDGIVLESTKYPTITFQSTAVTGAVKDGAFQINITGDITLHGVTRHITIPAAVTVNGDTLNAKGKFELNRSDFGVKATSAFHGWVRVKDRLTFTFDINAKRS
jgi:polyisoprenoid-binding protein YceI